MDTATERQNRMNQVVFRSQNLEEIKGAVAGLLDIFIKILSHPFDNDNYFGYKDVLDRFMKLDKNVWRDMRSKYLMDPYLDYIREDFSAKEELDPAKILLDLISLLSGVEKAVYVQLQDYENTFRKLKDQKRAMEEKMHAAEAKYIDEVQRHSVEHIELKTSLSKLDYLKKLVIEKNEKIGELQRYNTIELWEREKKKILMESNNKLLENAEEIQELKRVNSALCNKIQTINEQYRLMKLKHEFSEKPSGLAAGHALEDMKRKNFLLEKDVMFLEEELNTLQKIYVGILGGIRTDLHIVGEKYRDPESHEIKDPDIEKLDNRITYIYDKAKNAQLDKRKSDLLPHYLYVPQDVKLKRIKRLSAQKRTTNTDSDSLPPLNKMSMRRGMRKPVGFFTSPVSENNADDQNTEEKKPVTIKIEEVKPIENPNLLDPTGKFLNWDACKKHFPHLSKEFINEQWNQFKEYDHDSDRSLDFSEVISALQALGLQFTAMQAEEAMREADLDRSQTLDFYEYILVAEKIAKQTGRSELFRTGVVKSHTNALSKTCVVQ